MKNVCYISLFGFILGLFSCKGGDCDTEKIFYVDDELKSYMLHPVGSYWVYQDSATGSLDTISITYRFEELRNIDGACQYIEIINDRLYSSKNKESHIRKGFSLNALYLGQGGNGVDVYNGINKEQVFFSEKRTEYSDDEFLFKYLGYFENLTLSSKEYVDVRKYEYSLLDSQSFHRSNFLYISKGIGFIRKEYSNGEVWDLVDYNVD